MMNLSNMPNVVDAVTRMPGLTAYGYITRFGNPMRNSWVYAAFERARLNGRVRAETDGRYTYYFPVEN